jgi:hypothetical protein
VRGFPEIPDQIENPKSKDEPYPRPALDGLHVSLTVFTEFHENLGVQGQRILATSVVRGACPAVIVFVQDLINNIIITFSFLANFFESISCF